MAAPPRMNRQAPKSRLLHAARVSRGRGAMLASASPSSAAPSASSGAYARREPENTVPHRIVREHLETFLATVREERGKSLPRYVEEELRRYLRCGILAHGFLRVAGCTAAVSSTNAQQKTARTKRPSSRRSKRACRCRLFESTYVRLAGAGAPVPLAREEARLRAAGKGPWVAEASGFNVHAGVTVRSGDREGLERLCRYGARPK